MVNKLFTLCYVEKNEKVLMLHRVKKQKDIHEGKWNGLGGKLEAEESPKECAIREVKEESGLSATKLNFSGHIVFTKFDGENDWHVFVYHITDFEGELIECNEGNLKWIDKDKVLDLNLWEGDKLFIPLVLKDEKFMGKFCYENNKLVNYTIEPM